MSYLDRVLDDGSDREHWLVSRFPVIGASDAAKLAKPGSVPIYLRQKLERREFHGNEYTESGNRWEPMMLAWAGIPGNKKLIHSPDERGFAATPDGIRPWPSSALDAPESLQLAECKTKHLQVVDGPSLGEWRQIAWQLLCLPEAIELEFIWVELDADGEIRSELRGEPKHLTIRRDDPKVISLQQAILPIATDLLARLHAALDFERELAS